MDGSPWNLTIPNEQMRDRVLYFNLNDSLPSFSQASFPARKRIHIAFYWAIASSTGTTGLLHLVVLPIQYAYPAFPTTFGTTPLFISKCLSCLPGRAGHSYLSSCLPNSLSLLGVTYFSLAWTADPTDSFA